MNKVKLTIFNRSFELNVIYSRYSGEEILESQKKAYQEFINCITFDDKILNRLKKYCLDRNAEQISTNQIDNIFKYVIPKTIYVDRSKSKHKIGLMCKYKYDLENGIVLIFENNKLIKIDTQDAII